MLKCDNCKKEWVFSVRVVDGKCYCKDCLKQPIFSVFVTLEKVFIKDYGFELKSRINEARRRVILPYERGDNGYYVGRRGDDGKIAERMPCD